MKAELIIALIVVVAWVFMISSSKEWIGTKVGDVFVVILGVSSLYGVITASTELYKWVLK